MSEIALISVKKFKLENAIKKGNKSAIVALELANNPNKFLSTVQIGMTLIGILTGIFSGDKLTEDLATALSTINFISAYAHIISVIIIVVCLTFVSIILGELLPKRIGLMYSEKIAYLLCKPMYYLSRIARPFIWLLMTTNDYIIKLFGLKDNMDDRITEEEIKAIVQNSADEGEIKEIEHDIVTRVFALGDRIVSEIMTHRMDIVCLDINNTLNDIRAIANIELHSIYPVTHGSLDKLIGIVNVKQLFAANPPDTFTLKDYIKTPLYVHESTPAYYVLEKFREKKSHLAIVVDECGSIQGIITMDDVVDALVGDVTEDYNSEYKIEVKDANSWLADAQYPFFEMLRYFDISEEDIDCEYNTIAGLVLGIHGFIPLKGDKVTWNDYVFEAIEVTEMRIDKLLITKL
jgi:putative hemolysin